MNITISIDDNHPEKGWGIQGDPQMDYLESLWKEFGAKFTLFIPSNFHKQYPISDHKDWITWMLSKPYLELAAHGHYHQCDNPGFGQMEFAELQNIDKIFDRIDGMMWEWMKVGYKPKGWRNPGWIASNESIKQLSKTFEWVALHEQHNHGIIWDGPKMLFGHIGIHESSISIQPNNTIMFQSHIAGEWNDNIWSEKNYNHFREVLKELKLMDKLEFKTLSEI